jgi:hypothetical protein
VLATVLGARSWSDDFAPVADTLGPPATAAASLPVATASAPAGVGPLLG